MDFVLKDCIEFYLWSLISGVSLNAQLAKALFLAAIFHDVLHLGAGNDDHLNILRAREMVVDYFDLNGDIQSVDRTLRKNTLSIISSTEYPYVDVDGNNELQFYCGVIRDADLMTILHGDTGRNMVATGLFQELEKNGYGKGYEEFLRLNESFLQKIDWYTTWGKSKQHLLDQSILALHEVYSY
jgi:hypothetical protein